MVGYPDPCPLCGNNKRRRSGPPRSRSDGDDGLVLHPASPPPACPKSISDPLPWATPPTDEIVPTGVALKPTSPPVAGDAAAPRPALPSGGAGSAPSSPKTPLSGRPGVKSTDPPESSEGSSPLSGALPIALPGTAAPHRASTSSGAFQSPRRPEAVADGIKEEAADCKKRGERGAPWKAAKEKGKATMLVRCECGRLQEFTYRSRA